MAAAAGSSELELFRRRWRAELAGARQGKKRRRAAEAGGSPSRREPVSGWSSCGGVPPAAPRDDGGGEARREAGYFALARSLLDGKAPGARSRRRPRPLPPPPAQPAEPEGGGDKDLLGQLIRDLNEINEVPFFDIQLPYELALNIFQYLGRTELGRCAQVSRTWKVLAEDEVLWYRLCQQEGYLPDASISDCSCWKSTLQDCRAKERILRTNWKNRIGAVSQLQYELGKVLCDVHSCDGVVIAGLPVRELKTNDITSSDRITKHERVQITSVFTSLPPSEKEPFR